MILSYAVDLNQNWVHIDDVALGGRTFELFCPFCGNPLIAKKGEVLIHHFAHEANQSCRDWLNLADHIPPYEGYYVANLSPAQQRLLVKIIEEHGTRPFEAEHIRRQTLNALSIKRFLDIFDAPYIYRNDDYQRMTRVARLTPRAQAFAHQLSLAEYAVFAEIEQQRAVRWLAEQDNLQAQVAMKLLQTEYQRWQDTHLYLLEIETEAGRLLKIGVTTRPLNQRIQEVRTFLRQHYVHVEIQPLFDIPQVPYLEGYFKSKFAEYQFAIDNTTEYFRPFAKAHQEMKFLQQRVEVGIAPPIPQPPTNADRPRFRAMIWRKYEKQNLFRRGDDHFLTLVDVINLSTQERFADWQSLAIGKQLEKLEPLNPGDVLEFDATIEKWELKRPRKVVKTQYCEAD